MSRYWNDENKFIKLVINFKIGTGIRRLSSSWFLVIVYTQITRFSIWLTCYFEVLRIRAKLINRNDRFNRVIIRWHDVPIKCFANETSSIHKNQRQIDHNNNRFDKNVRSNYLKMAAINVHCNEEGVAANHGESWWNSCSNCSIILIHNTDSGIPMQVISLIRVQIARNDR